MPVKIKVSLITAFIIILLSVVCMRCNAENTVSADVEISDTDIEAMAKLMYGEGRGIESDAELAAIGWCVCNRVDSDIAYFPDSVIEVITQKNQFAGYSPDNPITDRCRKIAEDVLTRWYRERAGEMDVGRTIPKDYLYFIGFSGHNWYSVEYRSLLFWDWSLPDPYEE